MTQQATVSIQRLAHGEGLDLPFYASKLAAGADICAAIENDIQLEVGTHRLIPTGFSMALPAGLEAQIRPRSGLALHHGITVLNSPGTIDADYRGEVGVILINHGHQPFTIQRGDRIAQMIIAAVMQVNFQRVSIL
ncbi:MAG: dUTP diphosphatase, partial [Mariprofundaceae bacterium]|nr:dUTP diphosphatase [Mariprofundaceae bacterium]